MLKKILRIKLLTITSIILVIILIQLITAYGFGFKTERILNSQFQKISQSPYIKVEHYKYNRGIFSSNIEVTLSLNNQLVSNLFKVMPDVDESKLPQTAYSISYTTHVSQGIFAGLFTGELLPTLAITKTNIIYPEAFENILKKFFVNKPPINITNIIYLNGNGKFLINSPAFNYEEALSGVKVVWDGLQLSSRYNEDFNQFRSKLIIPNFSFNAPNYGNIQINGFNYSSNTTLSSNQINIGDTNLMLKLIQVNFTNISKPKLMLGDLLSSLTGITAGEFLNELDIINPTEFKLSNLAYSSTSSDSNGYFNAKAKINFESLVTESNSYGPFNLDTSINHVLSAPFSKMIDELTVLSTDSTLSTNNLENKARIIAVLKKYFTPILINSPVISIDDFSLATPNGEVNLKGNFTTQNFKPNDINNSKQFFNKINANLSFAIPKHTLNYLFELQMKYFLNAGVTAIDKQSAEALNKVVSILLNNQIATWKKKGYLKEQNDIISSNLSYKNGRITINP